MANSIGITFLPSEEQAAEGPKRGSMEGDLGQQAFKILSLRLPRVLGARPIAPRALLESPGSAGALAGQGNGGLGPSSTSGFNPHLATMESVVRALMEANAGSSTLSAGGSANVDPTGGSGMRPVPRVGFDTQGVPSGPVEPRPTARTTILDKLAGLLNQAPGPAAY